MLYYMSCLPRRISGVFIYRTLDPGLRPAGMRALTAVFDLLFLIKTAVSHALKLISLIISAFIYSWLHLQRLLLGKEIVAYQ